MTHTVTSASNARTGLRVASADCAEEMAAFDALPAPLRHAMASATVKGMALEAASLVAFGFPAADLVEALAAGELSDLRAFGSQYRAKHGLPLPHLAAQASFLRP